MLFIIGTDENVCNITWREVEEEVGQKTVWILCAISTRLNWYDDVEISVDFADIQTSTYMSWGINI